LNLSQAFGLVPPNIQEEKRLQAEQHRGTD